MLNQNILTNSDIEDEIRIAAIEERDIDFSDKTLPGLILEKKVLEQTLNLEGATILSGISLEETVLKKGIRAKGAKINGSFYLGLTQINGDVNLADLEIKGGINFVEAMVAGVLCLDNLRLEGFLSLSRAQFKKDVLLRNMNILDSYQAGLIIKGDVYLREAVVAGNLDISGSKIEGTVDLVQIFTGGNVNLENAKIGNFLITKKAIIKGKFKLNGATYKEIIE